MTIGENLANLGKTIAKFGAPLLGTALGGPAGGAIASIIAAQFGGNANDPQALAQLIETDPNARIKLAEIESNKKVQLENIAMQMAQNQLQAETQQLDIAARDTADARKNNVESKSYMPQAISFMVIFGFFACIWVVAAYKQDSDDHDVLYMMFGGVSSAFGAVIQYWLGSSAGSRIKTNILGRRSTD